MENKDVVIKHKSKFMEEPKTIAGVLGGVLVCTCLDIFDRCHICKRS